MLLNKRNLTAFFFLSFSIFLFYNSTKQMVLAGTINESREKSGLDDNNRLNFKNKLEFESTEILIGEVVSVDNIIEPEKNNMRYFEIKVIAVSKSVSDINIDHK